MQQASSYDQNSLRSYPSKIAQFSAKNCNNSTFFSMKMIPAYRNHQNFEFLAASNGVTLCTSGKGHKTRPTARNWSQMAGFCALACSWHLNLDSREGGPSSLNKLLLYEQF
jgi:hypothetical protein